MIMRIKVLREAANLQQTEIASALNVTQGTVSGWEKELYLPKARQLPLLAQVLNCTIDDLFEPIGEAAG